MEWIRNARVESGTASFGESIKPSLAVVDASLPSATGARRADLLAHVDQSARDGGAVVLDLSGLEYVSSAGLRCFMLASRQAKAQQ